MSADGRIRLATPDDAEALGSIEAASYLATYWVLDGVPCPIVRYRLDRSDLANGA